MDPYLSFEEFFAAHYGRLVRVGVALTGDVHAAEDLAQDAFLAARRNWDRIGHYDDPAAWIRRAVTNRATSRHRRAMSELKALARLSSTPVHLPEPHDELWAAVRRLPRRQAQALVLVVVEDLAVDDVAVILGCGPETVRTHLRRARSTLAARLNTPDEP